jgi:hypothetical protein
VFEKSAGMGLDPTKREKQDGEENEGLQIYIEIL